MGSLMRNENWGPGGLISAEIIDVDARTISFEENGVVVSTRALTDDERRTYGPQPLDKIGALATLLAVKELVPVEDAANAVGLTPEALTNEALGWAAAADG